MLNFYVNLTGRYVITDAGRATTIKQNFKAHDYKQKYKK